ENDMRGYFRDRFRDKHYAAAQIEYRAPLFWRLGAALFAGVGDVSQHPLSFRYSTLKHSVGAGLRFMADRKERVNLRFDFAVGRNETAFYLSFGEAF
ncbi:MAG: BamA/TamA family outer membrane protein, partial [Bacteroidia bacterium]|nr:BamA/TamA family outer membrane protein [Bacteroidia bacterium]